MVLCVCFFEANFFFQKLNLTVTGNPKIRIWILKNGAKIQDPDPNSKYLDLEHWLKLNTAKPSRWEGFGSGFKKCSIPKMLVHRWNFLTSQQKKVYTEKAWMWIRILWHADPNPKSKNQPEKKFLQSLHGKY